MLDQLFRPGRRRFLLDRIRANLLAEEFEGFAQYLSDRRHSRDVIRQYLRAVEHLGTWLRSRRIPTLVHDFKSPSGIVPRQFPKETALEGRIRRIEYPTNF